MTAATATNMLDMRGVSKSFPGVRALKGVDLTLSSGEVLALLGENGAGKSTLMKILGGAVEADEGTIRLQGEPISIRSPLEARQRGIAIIHQELNLVPALSARENIFLGQEQSKWGWIRRRGERERAARLLRDLGASFSPDVICRNLTISQQQIVEIARALVLDAKILVFDEPTASLTLRETSRLFALIRELQGRGLGIIYISHKLDEIFTIADRVSVLRDGMHVQTTPVSQVSRQRLIEMMVGRSLTDEFPQRTHQVGEVRLTVRQLCRGQQVRGVSFQVRRGEVLGITGLVGSGRTETARLIFGADRLDSGRIGLDGIGLRIRTPRDAIRAGIGLLTEDRKRQGLVLAHSSRHNFGLPNLNRLSLAGFVQQGREESEFEGFRRQLRIRLESSERPAAHLSGGNQQKIVLAKWLARNCEVLIFDEPTRGVDVGAKYDIYVLMNELAARGKSIILISSELPEVLGMSDRILVMRQGAIRGEITNVRTATQTQIMELAVGDDYENRSN